jgi:alginate O-acetyltransferase complex protein AlgI
MVFSSTVFLLYFLPAFFITYFIADRKYKNFIILIFSIFFYNWGAPKFIFVLLGTTVCDFYLVKWMWESDKEWKRKSLLSLSVSINVGLLFYFKYSNFFIEQVIGVFNIGSHAMPLIKLALPVGISFYTFETITYVVDVYRKVHKPLNNFWNYQTYIILFPKLIAGPIVRFHEIADQITDRGANETIDNKLTGFYRFIIGLSKKVLIANIMGLQADKVFTMKIIDITSSTAWLGILAYTFQIYFDFSGYSDMAIGIGKMIGFKFPENFDNPYTSQSITEFWRRWHITLGNWMRNYLYIPLGGNRVNNRMRLYFNLWLVFLASGLWHGASWTFVFWGAYHGFFLVMERAFLLKAYKYIPRFLKLILTFTIVASGWVFFRSESLKFAFSYLEKMYSFKDMNFSFTSNKEILFIFSLSVLFSFFQFLPFGKKVQMAVFFPVQTPVFRHILFTFSALALFIICLSYITGSDFNPFIYYRF